MDKQINNYQYKINNYQCISKIFKIDCSECDICRCNKCSRNLLNFNYKFGDCINCSECNSTMLICERFIEEGSDNRDE